jgi:hypothetical protein
MMVLVHLLPGRGSNHGGRPAATPVAGLEAQLCGDAPVELRRVRLAGARLLVDLNDFDETLPGPFSTT